MGNAVLEIPEVFDNILKTSPSDKLTIDHLVQNSIVKTLVDGKLVFFPEYTDHGWLHINNVLRIIAKLVPEQTLPKLTAKEIVVLVAAAVCHDMAMHCTNEMFHSLLWGEYGRQPALRGASGQSRWAEYWEDYRKQVSHWDGRALERTFGKNFSLHELSDIQNTPGDKWRGLDYLYVGEFLRWRHGELAHCFCVNGIPTVEGSAAYIPELEGTLNDLLGQICESHGLPLKQAVNRLEEEHGDKAHPSEICATYIMALLRLADYLDMTGQRVHFDYLKLTRLSSNKSLEEWSKHNIVSQVDIPSKQLRESIFIQMNPDPGNIHFYLAVMDLIEAMQEELDQCWLILNDVYRHDRDFGLTCRYIKGNYETPIYQKKLAFVPERIHFDVNPQIMGLLASPLYGNRPEAAVREMIQNAMDACGEAAYLLGKGNYTPEIKASLSQKGGQYLFEITDNGVGMDLEIIKNYFLVAGATYCTNEKWKEAFAEEDGTQRILRSGRFGVGVFSAFILGERIEVETWRYQSANGYSFQASVHDADINVANRCPGRTQHGTTIRIQLEEGVYSKLTEQMFGLDNAIGRWFTWVMSPYYTIQYEVEGAPLQEYFKQHWDQRQSLNKMRDEMKRRLLDQLDPLRQQAIYKENLLIPLEVPAGAAKVWWAPSVERQGLYHNGIYISDRVVYHRVAWLIPVALVIEDKAKIVPISLTRNSLAEKPMYEDAFLRECIRYVVASILVADLEEHEVPYWEDQVYYKKDGVFLYLPDGMAEEIIIIIHHTDRETTQSLLDNFHSDIVKSDQLYYNVRDGIKWAINQRPFTSKSEDYLDRFYIDGRAFYFRKGSGEAERERVVKQFRLLEDPHKNMAILCIEAPEYLATKNRGTDNEFFVNEVRKILSLDTEDHLIPYSYAERVKKFPNALKELDFYVRYIRRCKARLESRADIKIMD